jgi:hypothetical protein
MYLMPIQDAGLMCVNGSMQHMMLQGGHVWSMDALAVKPAIKKPPQLDGAMASEQGGDQGGGSEQRGKKRVRWSG